jgi:XTP/dITP diphosphohydrolase
MDILIATRNPGKFKEISAMLSGTGARFFSPSDLEIAEDFDETGGESYEENALGKARFYGKRADGMIVVADDSGLKVDALEGELGVKTRRWGAGEKATDKEWLDYFMDRMKSEDNRKASFVCAAAIRFPDCRENVFIKGTPGAICHEVKAPIKPGIPLSSVFLPTGYDKVYAEMTHEEKNELSHRGKAFAEVLNHLKTQS